MNKKTSIIARRIKEIALFRNFIILTLCHLVAGTLEDYFFWIAKQEMSSFVLGAVAQIILLTMVLLAILIVGRTIRRKDITWIEKTCYIFFIICIFIFIQQASYLINEYLSFKGGGIVS